MFEITSGIVRKPLKVVVYGVEGVGKSSFMSHFPDPLFIDTEGSTAYLDVKRLLAPKSWSMLAEEIMYIKQNPQICKSLIIDTADWAERLCSEYVCSVGGYKGIEDFGYGKGFTYLYEEWGRFLNILNDLIDCGINVGITAHAEIKKVEQPEEIGGYDHWQLKLTKGCGPLLKEWADLLLFANYKTLVVNVDNQGATKGKNKGQGSKRVMYTMRHACWDAKNRFGLKEELPFDFNEIAHIFNNPTNKTQESEIFDANNIIADKLPPELVEDDKELSQKAINNDPSALMSAIEQLEQLCNANNVHPNEVAEAVARNGYYPAQTKIINYDVAFIQGILIGHWNELYQDILENREVTNGKQ